MKPAEERRDHEPAVAGWQSPSDPPLNDGRRACQQCVGQWQRVRADLVRWLRGWGIRADDAEEFVDETIMRCWENLECDGCRATPWTWAWLCRVALNLAKNQQKAAERARSDADIDVESLPFEGPHVEEMRERVRFLIESLNAKLGCAELETLHCLRAGILRNSEIAQMRGVSIRAVKKARSSIRRAAGQPWKFS